MLRTSGWLVNKKRVERLWRREGLIRDRAKEAGSEHLIITEGELAYQAVMRCAEQALWIGQDRNMPLEMRVVDGLET
jgi:hypothetical protein